MYEPGVFEENIPISLGEDVAIPPDLEKALNYIQASKYSQEDNSEVIQPTIEDFEEGEDRDKDGDEKEQKVFKMSNNHRKIAKRKKKKYKKKMKKQLKNEQKVKETSLDEESKVEKLAAEVEYVGETLNVFNLVPMYRQYVKVFENFKIPEPQQKRADEDGIENATSLNLNLKKVPKLPELKEDEDDGENHLKGSDKLSRKQLKKVNRLSVAELKQLVSRPDVVEMHDVTARDPHLLIQLKAYHNTVPVPRHWCSKRKYLQGKRGFEKPPFDLPDFIKRTGIMEMRAVHQEKEDATSLKNKMRGRVMPKMGKIDINYQQLHDAFFKFQTKPRLTIHGDLYYEGKECETKLRDLKPGTLSDELRTALGMPVGHNAHKIPPPWLIAMQRYGPPPSYPALKIPGVSAAIPEGSSFGYHAGGWGKPPVNEFGRPLYGDVFGAPTDNNKSHVAEEPIDKFMWGELESEESEEEEEEKEEEEGIKKTEEIAIDANGSATPIAEGLATSSETMSELPSSFEIPEYIELRKRKIEFEMESSEQQPLYRILPEKKVDIVLGSMVASTHVYDIRTDVVNKSSEVEVSLDPSELDLAVNVEAIVAKYEQKMKDRQCGEKKRKAAQEAKPSKKYKDFKF